MMMIGVPFVCLFVCVQDYSKSNERIFMKLCAKGTTRVFKFYERSILCSKYI